MCELGRKGMKLKSTYWGVADEFLEMDGDCSCHINAPCYICTHEGNPQNLNEDDDAWEIDSERE